MKHSDTENQNQETDRGTFEGEPRRVDDLRLYRKTITPATIESQPERCVVAKAPTLLFRVRGEARGTNLEQKMAGDKVVAEFNALVGEFTAFVYEDNPQTRAYAMGQANLPAVSATYYAGQCYLPTGFHEAKLTELAGALEAEFPYIRFDYEFAAEPASNPRGYRWIARNLEQIIYDRSKWLMQAPSANISRLPILGIGSRKTAPEIAAK